LAHLIQIFKYKSKISSTKLEIRAEQVLSGSQGEKGGEGGEGVRGRNDPNNVCTCE
jgi:hypothetical protein